MSEGAAKFACPACGRRYPWKQENACRKAKCRCGSVMEVPALPMDLAAPPAPAAAASAPPAPQCPACGAALAASAVLCVQCGYNRHTGAAVATQVEDIADAPLPAPRPMAPAAPAPAAAPRRRAASPGRGEQDDASSTIRRAVLVGVLLLLVIGLIVGAKFYLKGSRQQPLASGPMLGEDEKALKMLRDWSPIEAHDYMKMHESYCLGVHWTRSQCNYRIDQWYSLGAKKVWAFTAAISTHVIFELPDDAAKRKALFDWVKQWDEDHVRKPRQDVGQKYLIVEM